MPAGLVDYTRNVAADKAEIGEFVIVKLRKFAYALVRLSPITKKLDNLANKHDNIPQLTCTLVEQLSPTLVGALVSCVTGITCFGVSISNCE